MKIALTSLLFVALAASTAAAAAPSCSRKLSDALADGGDGAASCFTPGASWEDHEGLHTGQGARQRGWKALLSRSPVLPKGGALTEHKLADGSVLAGAYTPGSPSTYYFLKVTKAKGGWSQVKVYSGLRPWPKEAADVAETDVRQVEKDFNLYFSSGNLDAWMKRWWPKAEFITGVGPYGGLEIRGFFTHQLERYRQPRMTINAVNIDPRLPGAVVEATISGSCRSTGEGFDIGALLLMRFKDHKILYMHESFAHMNEKCGEFWTQPH